MPSLTNRKNGVKTPVLQNSKGNILLKTNSAQYMNYISLRSDDKAIMDTLLYVSTTDTNHLIATGETLETIIDHSGYSKSTVQRALVRLKQADLIHSLQLPYEFIINPLFALKGTECAIWKFIQTVEYKGDIPREVQLECSELTLSTNY